jgi:hypothetical protein
LTCSGREAAAIPSEVEKLDRLERQRERRATERDALLPERGAYQVDDHHYTAQAGE